MAVGDSAKVVMRSCRKRQCLCYKTYAISKYCGHVYVAEL